MNKKRYTILIATLLLMISPLSAQETGRTYVIVHGAWSSIESWLPIESMLEQAGHHVYLASLTGLGDRAHLRRPDINLETHILDVVNMIEIRNLSDIYLVGHSYGGMVITGVWDRQRDRIKHVVYLDAFMPENGTSNRDYLVNEDSVLNANDDIIALAAENEGWVPLGAGRLDIADPPLHPLHTIIDPLVYQKGPLPSDTLRTYVRAVGSDDVQPAPTFRSFAEAFRDNPDWNYLEIQTGHGIQGEDPEGLLQILLELE